MQSIVRSHIYGTLRKKVAWEIQEWLDDSPNTHEHLQTATWGTLEEKRYTEMHWELEKCIRFGENILKRKILPKIITID